MDKAVKFMQALANEMALDFGRRHKPMYWRCQMMPMTDPIAPDRKS